MRLPVVRGVIDRRVLVNYRVDPEVLSAVLPSPSRPKLVGGSGIAGIYLIRLRQIRPRLVPSVFGITSENAAHRIAVEWGDNEDFRVEPRVLRRGLLDNGYVELVITGQHAAAVDLLPPIHKDPFDRLLISQAQVEGVPLITADRRLAQYPGPVRLV